MPVQNPPQPSNIPSTLDFSFGDFGTRVLEGTEVKAIAVLKAEGVNQGKIIGVISTGTGTFKLFRLNKTGVLDTTFGPTGTGYSEDRFGATTSLSTPSGLAVIDNDQILVTGHVRASSLAPNFPAAALFNSNGSANLVFEKFIFKEPVPEPTQTPSTPPQTIDTQLSVAATEAKKILFSVNNNLPGPYRDQGLLIQLTFEGKLDKDLDGRGYIFFRHKNENTSVIGVVTQADGRIVLAGSTPTQGFLAGFTSTGQIDSTFGPGGTRAFESTQGSIKLNKLLQSDNKLVAIGTVTASTDQGWVTRTHTDGTLDDTFNNGKAFITPYPFRRLQWKSADIDSQGSIVVAGEIDSRLCVVGRITEDGLADTTFSATGLSNPLAEHTPNVTTSVCAQTQTQIIVAGKKTSEPSVSRYHG
jgi:uncharacterized delta-60 repeat protein